MRRLAVALSSVRNGLLFPVLFHYGRLHAKGYTLAHHLQSGSPTALTPPRRHARPRAAGRHSPKRLSGLSGGVLRVLRRLGGPCERGGVVVS